jgi:hypothetical protein
LRLRCGGQRDRDARAQGRFQRVVSFANEREDSSVLAAPPA